MSESHSVEDPGEANPLTVGNKALNTGAAATQTFSPLKSVCAHLNAFHAYDDDRKRFVEANHYCAHLSEPDRDSTMTWKYADDIAYLDDDVRQCLLYDSDGPGARLIGIEYMITRPVYESLPAEERRLWHSHVYEVKSGMLIMPNRNVPEPLWEVSENAEMNQVVDLYGKVYHLWQTDKGHQIPLGEPQLMTSFTADGQLDFEKHVGERDERFGTDYRRKRESRRDIQTPQIHPDADQAWKQNGKQS